jgi:hypothetical protein
MTTSFRLRFTNTAILILIAILTLTGVFGLVWPLHGWVFEAHRVAGWGLVAMLPWKTAITVRSFARGFDRRPDRSLVMALSIILATATLAVIALGLWWTWRLGPGELWLRQTAISWHWMISLGLLAPLAVHIWRRWPRPKVPDFVSRRGFLQMAGLAAAGGLGWWFSEFLVQGQELVDAPRRHTGSRAAGFFTGNRFPITHRPGDGQHAVLLEDWSLVVSGEVERNLTLSYADLQTRPAAEKIATLDCTLGWYTTQVWQGVALVELLEEAGLPANTYVVRLESLTGYAHLFTAREAQDILLATHVGAETLNHSHGYPLRAVVPNRRGWFWVKWLARVEVVPLLPT